MGKTRYIVEWLLNMVNEMLPEGMRMMLNSYNDVFCLELYKNDEKIGKLGQCVVERQLWRIKEVLSAIFLILLVKEEVKEQ